MRRPRPRLADQMTVLEPSCVAGGARWCQAEPDASDLIAYLKKQKLIAGEKTPRITKAGRARFAAAQGIDAARARAIH